MANDKTCWCVLSRHFTKNGKERLKFVPMPFADAGNMDPVRVYSTKKDCERACRLFNQLKGC